MIFLSVPDTNPGVGTVLSNTTQGYVGAVTQIYQRGLGGECNGSQWVKSCAMSTPHSQKP